MALRCSLGMHQGDWEYDYRSSCDQTRQCRNCSNVSTRVHHDFASWDFVDSSDSLTCASERECERCGDTDNEYRHEYQWVYYQDLLKSASGRPASSLLEFAGSMATVYAASKVHPCNQIMACKRCGQPEGSMGMTAMEHVWGRWQMASHGSGSVRVCERCGESEEQD